MCLREKYTPPARDIYPNLELMKVLYECVDGLGWGGVHAGTDKAAKKIVIMLLVVSHFMVSLLWTFFISERITGALVLAV